jgi:hypothetical protein
MAAHGYVVCAAGEARASAATESSLTRAPAWRTHALLRDRPRLTLRKRWVRHLSVGYEGDSGNEYWVEYVPERQGLNLLDWREVLRDRPDFDVSGSVPVERDELRRRLRALGEAVSAADTLEHD